MLKWRNLGDLLLSLSLSVWEDGEDNGGGRWEEGKKGVGRNVALRWKIAIGLG